MVVGVAANKLLERSRTADGHWQLPLGSRAAPALLEKISPMGSRAAGPVNH